MDHPNDISDYCNLSYRNFYIINRLNIQLCIKSSSKNILIICQFSLKELSSCIYRNCILFQVQAF